MKKTPRSQDEKDEAILDSLADDDSIAAAADASGLSERTVRSRMADPEFAAEAKRRASARTAGADEANADGGETTEQMDEGEASCEPGGVHTDHEVLGGGGPGPVGSSKKANPRRTPPKKTMSDAQLRANRSNASKSTGPRTAAGKSVVSANRTTSGVYAETLRPVTTGPLAEDRADFTAFVRGLVEGLGPRDPLEFAQARQVVSCYVRLTRLDRLESETLAAEGLLSTQGLDSKMIDHRTKLDADTACLQRMVQVLEDGAPAKDPVFRHLVRLIGQRGPGTVLDAALAEDADGAERFWECVAEYWDTEVEAAAWARRTLGQVRTEQEVFRSAEVQHLEGKLTEGSLTRLAMLHGRLGAQLERHLKLYAKLQFRDDSELRVRGRTIKYTVEELNGMPHLVVEGRVAMEW